MSDKKNTNKGKYSYDGLERILHEKARLGIMTSLLINRDGLLFTELKSLVALTDGNLSRHLQHLEDEGLVEVRKSFKNKKPQTMCKITHSGKERFMTYLSELERVIQDASVKTPNEEVENNSNLQEGWITG